MTRTPGLLIASLLLAAACNPNYECEVTTCDTSGLSYQICAEKNGATVYSYPSGQCVCPFNDMSVCSACTAVIAAYCGSSDGGVADMSAIPGFAAPTKTGNYTGTMLSRNYTSESDCPDTSIEPNDTKATAITAPTVTPDNAGITITSLAICPNGPNPLAHDGHDVDLYAITVTSSPVGAVATLTYDVQYGDLDLGIYNSAGVLLAGDGSAVSNACIATTLPPGTYYVGVFGANATATNSYTLSVAYLSNPSAASCDRDGGT
jgi:hypothetical protein